MSFTTNPFAELSVAAITPEVMQYYVVAMIFAVIAGTIIDMMHKKSAKYFFENAEKAKKIATRSVSGGEKASLAVQTLAKEVITSGEFSSTRRRVSHLFTMYGFIIFVATTAIMIFGYSDSATPSIIPVLWHLGALMLCIGGYWFWFFIRVDVSAEGKSWYKLVRADLFIVSLLAMATLALVWSLTGSIIVFALFIAASTFLFCGVIWSKFAHMFFKPAAAYQKRITKADGSRESLPVDFDLTDAAVQKKFPDVPEYMGTNPPNMGLGIKSEAPRHY